MYYELTGVLGRLKMNDCLTPDYGNIALLTIDVQNDFTLSSAPLEVHGTREVLPNIRKLVLAFRRYKKPIIHVVRLYLPDGSNSDLCRREAIQGGQLVVTPNSPGAELVDEIKPAPEIKLASQRLLAGEIQLIGPMEWVMYKPRWGAFFNTNLKQHLEELSINTIALCGCNFPNCPRTTLYEASERDYRIVFATDSVSQIYDRGLTEMKDIGVVLQNSAEIEKLISTQN